MVDVEFIGDIIASNVMVLFNFSNNFINFLFSQLAYHYKEHLSQNKIIIRLVLPVTRLNYGQAT